MLEKVKEALRIKTAAYDGEIEGLIAACRADLVISGLAKDKADSDDDPLITRAAILYSKANFGYIEDNEKFQKSYDMLKCSLCLAGDYNGGNNQTA